MVGTEFGHCSDSDARASESSSRRSGLAMDSDSVGYPVVVVVQHYHYTAGTMVAVEPVEVEAGAPVAPAGTVEQGLVGTRSTDSSALPLLVVSRVPTSWLVVVGNRIVVEGSRCSIGIGFASLALVAAAPSSRRKFGMGRRI